MKEYFYISKLERKIKPSVKGKWFLSVKNWDMILPSDSQG